MHAGDAGGGLAFGSRQPHGTQQDRAYESADGRRSLNEGKRRLREVHLLPPDDGAWGEHDALVHLDGVGGAPHARVDAHVAKVLRRAHDLLATTEPDHVGGDVVHRKPAKHGVGWAEGTCRRGARDVGLLAASGLGRASLAHPMSMLRPWYSPFPPPARARIPVHCISTS